MPTPLEACAREVLDVMPLVMRTVRAEMRRHRAPGLTVPHFRALAFLGNNAGASLSEVAEHVGLQLPSMSTLIDGLVTRGLVSRAPSATDRRRVTLNLTPSGQATLATSRRHSQDKLAARLASLSATEQATIMQAMQALRVAFTPEPESAQPG
ncbi:MAG: MarR family transcriptional regulator [Anaerolineales bacterium]|nr:MarR family transcriptional regulator [Anaerolineales bacterium]